MEGETVLSIEQIVLSPRIKSEDRLKREIGGA